MWGINTEDSNLTQGKRWVIGRSPLSRVRGGLQQVHEWCGRARPASTPEVFRTAVIASEKVLQDAVFGLIDMARVHAYIVQCQYCKSINEKPYSHAKFRALLHQQLIAMTEYTFRSVPSPGIQSPTVSPGSSSASPRVSGSVVTDHHLEVANDKQPSGKVRYRVCKVCSILHTDASKPIGKSRTYCRECSNEKCRIYLCDRIRNHDGNQMTCFQVWHQLWKNGTKRQDGRSIRMRASTPNSSISFTSLLGEVSSSATPLI